MFTQEDKKELLEAIRDNGEAIQGNRDAIRGNAEAIKVNTKGIWDNKESINVILDAVRDNGEAIGMLAEQLEKHAVATRNSFTHVRDYLDRRILDVEASLMTPLRNEDQKVNRVVDRLQQKQLFTQKDVDDVMSLPVFPSI